MKEIKSKSERKRERERGRNRVNRDVEDRDKLNNAEWNGCRPDFLSANENARPLARFFSQNYVADRCRAASTPHYPSASPRVYNDAHCTDLFFMRHTTRCSSLVHHERSDERPCECLTKSDPMGEEKREGEGGGGEEAIRPFPAAKGRRNYERAAILRRYGYPHSIDPEIASARGRMVEGEGRGIGRQVGQRDRRSIGFIVAIYALGQDEGCLQRRCENIHACWVFMCN